MIYLGDYFAIGLVLVLSMFFFDKKLAINRTSKCYVACLLLTAATAVLSD